MFKKQYTFREKADYYATKSAKAFETGDSKLGTYYYNLVFHFVKADKVGYESSSRPAAPERSDIKTAVKIDKKQDSLIREHEKKAAYYARRTVQASRLGSGMTDEQKDYAASWSLGTDYVDALTKNGSKLGKAWNDKYLDELRRKKNRTASEEAFLRGANSFIRSCGGTIKR